MGARSSQGLDFHIWEHSVQSERKYKRLLQEYGAIGESVLRAVLFTIYNDKGYYTIYDNDLVEDIAVSYNSKKYPISNDDIVEIIEFLVKISWFNEQLFSKNILSSRGIQKRYFNAVGRRKNIQLIKELLLVDVPTKLNKSIVYISFNNINVNIMQTDVNIMQTDVNIMKTDVSIMQTDVSIMQTDVSKNAKMSTEVKQNSNNVNKNAKMYAISNRREEKRREENINSPLNKFKEELIAMQCNAEQPNFSVSFLRENIPKEEHSQIIFNQLIQDKEINEKFNPEALKNFIAKYLTIRENNAWRNKHGTAISNWYQDILKFAQYEFKSNNGINTDDYEAQLDKALGITE